MASGSAEAGVALIELLALQSPVYGVRPGVVVLAGMGNRGAGFDPVGLQPTLICYARRYSSGDSSLRPFRRSRRRAFCVDETQTLVGIRR